MGKAFLEPAQIGYFVIQPFMVDAPVTKCFQTVRSCPISLSLCQPVVYHMLSGKEGSKGFWPDTVANHMEKGVV